MAFFKRGAADADSGSSDTIAAGCEHLADAAAVDFDEGVVAVLECAGCVAIGERHWAHLRRCLNCGYVGCCDSSPRRHASAHFDETAHPVMQSAEPGENWRWCYVHALTG